MTTMKHRYSAAIQRVKGLLKLAAAVNDTSLSFQTRAAEQVLQTDSHVGYSLKLSLTTTRSQRENGVSLSFAADGFRELGAVAQGKVSLAWINSSVAATLTFKGKGPFSEPLPLRTLAVFPSYDVISFAVHVSTGVTSLAQIRKKQIPLRLSTGQTTKRALVHSPTMFTVKAVMEAAGFTLADIEKWGGKIQSVSRPGHPDRRAAIENGTINAVLDEGIKRWGQTAVDHGFRYLPVEGEILERVPVWAIASPWCPSPDSKVWARTLRRQLLNHSVRGYRRRCGETRPVLNG